MVMLMIIQQQTLIMLTIILTLKATHMQPSFKHQMRGRTLSRKVPNPSIGMSVPSLSFTASGSALECSFKYCSLSCVAACEKETQGNRR